MRNFIHKYPWALPVLAALAVHGASLFGAFVYDDVPLIVKHPELSSPGFLHVIWTRDYGFEYSGTAKGLYRPLFMTAVWGLHHVAGPSAFAFHLLSLLLFCLATALVTRTALLYSRESPAPAVIAGIFYGLHPARVETVSLVMSLPDLVVEICALGMVLCLAKPPSPATSRPAWKTAVYCLGLSLTAALTKESAFFVFPALALTTGAYGIFRRLRWGQVLPPLSGLLLGLGLAILPRLQTGVKAPVPLAETLSLAMGRESCTTLQTLVLAAREIVIPSPVVFWRNLEMPGSVTASLTLVAILVLAGLLWTWTVRKGSLLTALLVAWSGINMVNLILLSAGGYPYSQRYLALAPALILVCLGGRYLADIIPRRLRRLSGLGLAAYLTMHGAYALAGTFACWSPLGFFTTMQEANPRDVVPLGAVAQTLDENGAPASLVAARVKEATALNPKHPQVPRLHNLVIKRYLRDGSFAEALRFADWSLARFPADYDILVLKSVALAYLGRNTEAIAAVDRAIKKNPDNQSYHTIRSQIMARTPAP